MYRTFDIDPSIKPGTMVLSDQANTLSPKMMQVMFNALENLGDHVGKEAIDKPYMSDTDSQLEVLESFERLGPSFRATSRSLGIFQPVLSKWDALGEAVHGQWSEGFPAPAFS